MMWLPYIFDFYQSRVVDLCYHSNTNSDLCPLTTSSPQPNLADNKTANPIRLARPDFLTHIVHRLDPGRFYNSTSETKITFEACLYRK